MILQVQTTQEIAITATYRYFEFLRVQTNFNLAKSNLKSIVITDRKNISRTLKACDVLIVDTESRFDSAETAYKKVSETGKTVRNKDMMCIYKKLQDFMCIVHLKM